MAKIKPISNPTILPLTIEGQLAKVGEEYQEFVNAWIERDIEHAKEEAMDIIVAIRTFFSKLGMTEEEVDKLYKFVEEKNERRGYYISEKSEKKFKK